MGDLTFNEGVVRLNLVNQQYKVKSVMFNCCITSILINRCFECVFVNLAFINITVRIDMLQDDEHSVTLIDSIIINTGTTVKTVVQTTDNHSLVIENFVFDSDLTFVVTISESLILTDNVPDIWVYENVYTHKESITSAHKTSTTFHMLQSPSLIINDKYMTIPPLIYQQYAVNQFINMKQMNDLSV